MFPYIKTIDDVLPFIENKPEIIIARKEDFDVINYVVTTDTTFDNPVARECRGIKFDKQGKIIARPFHKFFNINQVAETNEKVIAHKFDQPHLIMPKLDGSMCHPIMVNNSVRLCTKMGITDVSQQAEEFLFGKENYQNLILYFLLEGYTPIFEWTSRKQRIVLDYPEDNLTLLAIRNNYTGVYLQYDTIRAAGNEYKVPVVGAFDPTYSVRELVDKARSLDDAEGFVVQFSDGDMVKAKSDWYCLRHSSRDLVTQEYKVIQLILSEEVDDLKPLLVDTDIKQVENLEKIVERLLEWIAISYELKFKYAKHYKTRKEFAISKMAKSLNSESRSAVFSMLDGKTSRELAINSLKKHSSKDGLWNEFKETYKGVFAANSLTWE